MSEHEKEVFFHVGLGKVASTYLQYRFFPKLKGIKYIQRTEYWRYHAAIQSSDERRFLISREFDRQLETEVRQFSADYPNAQYIIILRRHDSWIASQYRRFVKNGMYMPFEEFIDLKDDNGFWKIEQMTFHPMLQMVEEISGQRPIVLLYDELRRDPWSFYDKIADCLGATYDRKDISLKPVHRSYSEKQLKVIRSLRLYDHEPYGNMRDPVDWLRRRWRFLVCYSILYPAALLPERWVPSEPLIAEDALEQVRQYFSDDWNACLEYVHAGAPAQ